MTPLPIDPLLPRLAETLRHAPVTLLSAPPGSGKTTRVPLALLHDLLPPHERIIMLEPRRLAARRAAEYMAGQLNENVGESVGFRIRGESRVSPATRIEVVTEGVLTRLLQDDPALPGVAILIFDEFHERSIHADLGLALALDAQSNLRNDLRILVMSATLDGLRLATILPGAPLVECAGITYPVVTRYLGNLSDAPIERIIIDPIRMAIRESDGDILVFLPGQREIKRTAELLEERRLPGEIIHQLFGDASPREQAIALSPPPPGTRKIILSTSVAETSLTIEGVTAVVDSGLSRVPRFDPRRGMAGLVTIPVSRAGADQRRGRAGRTRPGVCYRLWSEAHHRELSPYARPEILAADLAPLALELALWRDPDGRSLRFIDPPPEPHLRQAQGLLRSLGALDENGRITPHGTAMGRAPLHPRYAHMLIRGSELGLGGMSCDLAALLEDRELLTGSTKGEINLSTRWDALRTGRGADPGRRERILREGERLRRALKIPEGKEDPSRCGILLACAYPERLARQRETGGGRYQMANGTGATLPRESPLSKSPFLAVGEADGIGAEVKVFCAAPVSQKEIEEEFRDQIGESEEIRWSKESESVIARKMRTLGALLLTEGKSRPEGPQAVAALIEGIRQMGLASLPWGKESTALRKRSQWLRSEGAADPAWPDMSDAALLNDLDSWLAPFLGGMWQRNQMQKIDLLAALKSRLQDPRLRELDRLAPAALRLPSGSNIPLLYEEGETPVLAVRLQELFGQTDTPTVGGGRVPVVIHLLSPARRPLAVTRDLKSFWTTTYPTLRTQMRARYPKHFWPENPLSAAPTNRTLRPRK